MTRNNCPYLKLLQICVVIYVSSTFPGFSCISFQFHHNFFFQFPGPSFSPLNLFLAQYAVGGFLDKCYSCIVFLPPSRLLLRVVHPESFFSMSAALYSRCIHCASCSPSCWCCCDLSGPSPSDRSRGRRGQLDLEFRRNTLIYSICLGLTGNCLWYTWRWELFGDDLARPTCPSEAWGKLKLIILHDISSIFLLTWSAALPTRPRCACRSTSLARPLTAAPGIEPRRGGK